MPAFRFIGCWDEDEDDTSLNPLGHARVTHQRILG